MVKATGNKPFKARLLIAKEFSWTFKKEGKTKQAQMTLHESMWTTQVWLLQMINVETAVEKMQKVQRSVEKWVEC